MTGELISYSDFVRLVVEALEASGSTYLIGGAVAAWAWGEPRTTLDLDVVVDIPVEAVGKLSQELEKRDMLVPTEVILDTLNEDRVDLPLNAIHLYSGIKADIYLLRPYDELRRQALARRVEVDFGLPVGKVFVHSPEDLIIYKLWYYSLSQQTKHIRDIAAILHNTRYQLDLGYIDTWAKRKGLQAIWEEIRSTGLID